MTKEKIFWKVWKFQSKKFESFNQKVWKSYTIVDISLDEKFNAIHKSQILGQWKNISCPKICNKEMAKENGLFDCLNK